MVNCTAVEHLDMMDAVYGDYMDGIGSIIFNEGSDLTITSLMKRRIRAFGALFVV
jgi:hypothetical protein